MCNLYQKLFASVFTEFVGEIYLLYKSEIAIQLVGCISAAIKYNFFLQIVLLLRVSVISRVQTLVLRSRNNAILRFTCITYYVYPRAMDSRMHIKVGEFARVHAPFFLRGRFFQTRTRDSIFMKTLNGNHSFTREPAMRHTEATHPIRRFALI